MSDKIVPRSHKKLFQDMTIQELKEEVLFWEQKLTESKEWGAAVGAAHEFCEDAKRWLKKRMDSANGP